ncbi:hypothetical protein BJF93_08815 [Xaviernesmea oryzae]|uniref:DUF2946 domain-containing protein n=1 Tax=Xaviernesmea oryzae TaxID=464029 RepID=A0A1Q9B136_9HYPH|nr:hypothetical protein [Xaviernesmea oryzae]OLP61691.1 hypothetical protein BJF93_08815 [Xaviernesmea oryzae]SEL02346.1 hypothetical protein SAMN04487976_105161 [Xaviernesmea oryzae]
MPQGRLTGGLAWRILCAIALLCVGLAHKLPPAFAESTIPPGERALYLLPDGSLPALCVEGVRHTSHDVDHDRTTPCEACRLSAAILLPVSESANGLVFRSAETARMAPRPARLTLRRLVPPDARPRAPPVLLSI